MAAGSVGLTETECRLAARALAGDRLALVR